MGFRSRLLSIHRAGGIVWRWCIVCFSRLTVSHARCAVVPSCLKVKYSEYLPQILRDQLALQYSKGEVEVFFIRYIESFLGHQSVKEFWKSVYAATHPRSRLENHKLFMIRNQRHVFFSEHRVDSVGKWLLKWRYLARWQCNDVTLLLWKFLDSCYTGRWQILVHTGCRCCHTVAVHCDGHLRISLVKLRAATTQCDGTHNIGTKLHVSHHCYHGSSYNFLLIFSSLNAVQMFL